MLDGIGDALAKLARHFNGDGGSTDICLRLQLLKDHISEAASDSALQEVDDISIPTLDDFSSESSDPSTDDVEELLRDVQSYNACLYGLVPVLENPAEKLDVNEDQTQNVSYHETHEDTAWPYIANVMDAYPSIDKSFARRLREANKVRYSRLQHLRGRARLISNIAEDCAEASQPLPSLGRVSSSYLHSVSAVPSTQISSVFDNKTKSSDSPKPPKRSASVTTFTSSEGKVEGIPQQRHRGIPKMPDDQPWGTAFNCTVCGMKLSNVWSSAQWV